MTNPTVSKSVQFLLDNPEELYETLSGFYAADLGVDSGIYDTSLRFELARVLDNLGDEGEKLLLGWIGTYLTPKSFSEGFRIADILEVGTWLVEEFLP